MFDSLNNPREVLGHKLGSALTMESGTRDIREATESRLLV
jgi:hypothetical protein